MKYWSLFVVVLMTLLLIMPAAQADDSFGIYSGEVKTRWLNDNRRMELLEDFSFTDPNGIVWHARKGNIIDGASIPRILWTLVGSPFTDDYRDASVIHDIACDEKTKTWEVVHLSFYYAMKASGVGNVKAKIMYAGVHHLGPRWPTKTIQTVTEARIVYDEERVNTCQNCILPKWEIIRTPRTVAEQRQVQVTIPPPPRTISEADFEELRTKIESEDLTLNEIREF